MSRHLKNIVFNGLKSTCATFVPHPAGTTPHSRSVRYFRLCVGVDCLWGAMDDAKEGRKRRKRIVVRPSRHYAGLFELYTFHFPKHWSEACVANRNLIKEAQRLAHALEHDNSMEALEWRIRFFKHYFTVVKGGAAPAPGMKRYSRFYQYTYVAIYRELKQNQKVAEDVTFEPIDTRSAQVSTRPSQADIIRRAVFRHALRLNQLPVEPPPPPPRQFVTHSYSRGRVVPDRLSR